MSAIGGIVNFKNGEVDFSDLNEIRKSMVLRGRVKSTAYIDAGIGMFYNADALANEEQPFLRERNGYKSVLLLDSPYLDGNAVFEKYRCCGVEFLELIDAPFALALYDSERRLLVLARDREGRKPLFYSSKNGRVCFSSEVKGILGLSSGAVRVNREVLSSHLTSTRAIYSPSEIYKDVGEIRTGECVLFSEFGVSRFFYKENSGKKKISAKSLFKDRERAYELSDGISQKDVLNSLSDSLVAFDIPQFHSDMPKLSKLFLSMTENRIKTFRYRDYIKREERRYSFELEDRLSSFYGSLGCGIISQTDKNNRDALEEEKKAELKILSELFFEKYGVESEFLTSVFGNRKMNYCLHIFEEKAIKKEDTEGRIRILGMLCQTFEWCKLRELDIRSENEFGRNI